MRIELKAQSQCIGCLSTIIVFQLIPVVSCTNLTPSACFFPQGPSQETTGGAAYVIRQVKVYFRDEHMEDLRPKIPFQRPPRVSGKHATVQIEGLPLER